MEKRDDQLSSSPPQSEASPASALHNKNRALKVLLHCNQVIFHAETEQSLLDEICRIIVKDAGYLLSWVGQPINDEGKHIQIVAHSGYEDDYLHSLVISWDDTSKGLGPAGMAIKSKEPYVVRDFHSDPNFTPWRQAAIEHGYAAVAAFPINIKGQVAAVILMYAAEENAFDQDELDLLIHFSETLTYGIEHIRLKEQNKKIAKNLKDSEQRFQFMLDSSPVAIRIAINSGRSIVYANPSYSTLLNTEMSKLSGIDPRTFYYDPDDYDDIYHELEQGELVKDRLVNLSIPKIGEKWILASYIPIEYEGEPAMVGWFYDITDRKKKEDALLLSEEEYVKAFRVVPDALSITTIDHGIFVEVNQGATALTGYQRDEMINLSAVDLGIWVNLSHRKQFVAEIQENGHVSNFETQLRTKNGDVIDVIVSGEPIEIYGQACIILSVRDFSEKKHNERELKKLRNYLSNIINSMPSIVIGVNADGQVTQWNGEAIKITGISIEEAQDQYLSEVFPRLSTEMASIIEAIQTRQQLSSTRKAYHYDGEMHYEDITIYPLVANDAEGAEGAEGAVVRIDDVTERVRLEEMMIQSEKMLSVGGLAAGMAHEINNPLAGMMQTASVMSNRLTNKSLSSNIAASQQAGIDLDALYNYMEARGIRRMLSAINESGQRIAEIIDNMLNFARKSDVVALPWNIADLLDKSLTLAASDYDLKKQFDFKSIKVIRDYQNDVPEILCEASKIQQVFLNLFRNSAEAMQGNTSEPATFTLRTSYSSNDDMISIEIEDNGSGMEEQVLDRLFEPFFTTKHEGVGTGLGLSVSYFIITENHRGEMTAFSKPGKGTRFIIRLPISTTT